MASLRAPTYEKAKLIAHQRAEKSTIRKYATTAGAYAEAHYKAMYLAHMSKLTAHL